MPTTVMERKVIETDAHKSPPGMITSPGRKILLFVGNFTRRSLKCKGQRALNIELSPLIHATSTSQEMFHIEEHNAPFQVLY
uniref:SFRICE_038089 n=1 Tax=Spodoptera frugiperda TaxID=7108 RepID=A0A2H1WRP6_SPOFR